MNKLQASGAMTPGLRVLFGWLTDFQRALDALPKPDLVLPDQDSTRVVISPPTPGMVFGEMVHRAASEIDEACVRSQEQQEQKGSLAIVARHSNEQRLQVFRAGEISALREAAISLALALEPGPYTIKTAEVLERLIAEKKSPSTPADEPAAG